MIDRADMRARLGLSGVLGAWLAYLGVVLLLDRTILGHRLSIVGLAASVALAVAVFFEVASRVAGTWPRPAIRRTTGVLAVALTIVLAVDTLYAVYRQKNARTVSLDVVRARDRTTWIGEVYPPLWEPEGAHARFHKPSYAFRARHYGDFYSPALYASPTLAQNVFALKDVEVVLDRHGFRNRLDPAAAEIFALGDSFTFGWAVTDGKTWVDLLAARLNQPIYNLGVHDGGPEEQLNRLRYLLDTKPESFRPRRVIWMLFGGNDLEDRPGRSALPQDDAERTLVDVALGLPYVVRGQSVLGMLTRGDLHLSARFAVANPYVVDGVRMRHPLVHSATHGYMLFGRHQLERARAPRSYVTGHPNLPSVVAAFRGMEALARTHGFAVTVVLMPSAPRLYGAFVEGLDPPIEYPHFLAELARLGHQAGFDVIDMLPLLQPYAARELLYFRDDDHCNERGHAVIAELLAAVPARVTPAAR